MRRTIHSLYAASGLAFLSVVTNVQYGSAQTTAVPTTTAVTTSSPTSAVTTSPSPSAATTTSIVPTSTIQPANDELALLTELAARLAGQGFGANVKVLPGKVASFDPPISLPSGWRVIGSVDREQPQGSPGFVGRGANIFLDAPVGSVSETISVLTKTLTASGWKAIPYGAPGEPGGFVVPSAPQNGSISLCSSSAQLYANAIKEVGGPVKFSINVNTVPAGLPNQCDPNGPGVLPPTIVPGPIVYLQIPRLVLPDTTKIVFAGYGGGSPFASGTGATIDEAPEAGALLTFFEPQMKAAGWQQSSVASGSALSVSLWTKTVDKTPLQAVLSITNGIGGSQRRDLSLTVSQEAKGDLLNGGGIAYPAAVATTIPFFAPVETAPPATLTVETSPPKKAKATARKPAPKKKK